MGLNDSSVCFARLANVGEEIRAEKTRSRLYGFENTKPTEYFTTIVTRHPDGRNLCGALVNVEIGRMSEVHTTVGEVYGAFRIVGKPRQEVLPDRNYLVRLPAYPGHSPSDGNVPTVAKHSPKR